MLCCRHRSATKRAGAQSKLGVSNLFADTLTFLDSPPAGASVLNHAVGVQRISTSHISFSREGDCVHTPPGLDWIDLIEWYAFRLFLLLSFLYTLWQLAKHKLKG